MTILDSSVLEVPQKERKTKGIFFCNNSFGVGMDLKKVWKQGREENTQDDYPTTEQWQEKKDKETTLHVANVG